MKFLLLFVLLPYSTLSQTNSLPLSTALTIDRSGEYNKGLPIENVFLIINSHTGSKGTGFLIKGGYIVTNYHVVADATKYEITASSSEGIPYNCKGLIYDSLRDLAVIIPFGKLTNTGMELDNSNNTVVGDEVFTWGYPLSYNGPQPILSVGYVASFQKEKVRHKFVEHIIVNGAFNSGNSGGALLSRDGKVIGVVVNKALPVLSPMAQSAVDALANNSSGLIYNYTQNGQTTTFSEAQVLALILKEYRQMGQLMIGEAIAITELRDFLHENKLSDY